AVRQADAAHLPEGGVRLLGRRRVDTNADAALLRARFQGGGRRLEARGLAALSGGLIYSRHAFGCKLPFSLRESGRPARPKCPKSEGTRSILATPCLSRRDVPGAWRQNVDVRSSPYGISPSPK